MTLEVQARRVVDAWHRGTIYELYEEVKGLQRILQTPQKNGNGRVKVGPVQTDHPARKRTTTEPPEDPASCST